MSAPNEVVAYRVRFSEEEIEDYLRRAQEILERGVLAPGINNAELERKFGSLVGARHTTAVASGTAALEIALRCLGLAGRTVLIPANTNYATAEAALRSGCRVILYDSHLYPSVAALEAVWTPEVAGVVVVHIGGYLSPALPEIVSFCRARGVKLVEDASHAHGSALLGQAAGTFGDAAAFSMFATKVITTGEGGILTTDDDRVAADSRRYRDQGKADDGVHNVLFGSAWRMSELHAALGIAQMHALPGVLERLNAVVARYATEITHPCVTVPWNRDVRHSGHKMIILVDDGRRDELREHLCACGVRSAKGVYEVPLHRQPALGLDADARSAGYPAAERFAVNHLCLPLWKGVTDEEVDRVIHAVNSWRPTA